MSELLYELDRLSREDDEEEVSAEKIASKETDNDDAGVDDIIKHIEAVEAAADYIDKMTPGDKADVAFDAEMALRKALAKMKDLSDTVYKELDKEEETEEV